MVKSSRPQCRDCGDLTNNNTERCGPCRIRFNEKVKDEKLSCPVCEGGEEFCKTDGCGKD